MTGEHSVAERPVVVGADVVECPKRSGNVEQRHESIAHLERNLARVGQVGRLGYADEVGHVGAVRCLNAG